MQMAKQTVSEDPDQIVPTLFAQTYASKYLDIFTINSNKGTRKVNSLHVRYVCINV